MKISRARSQNSTIGDFPVKDVLLNSSPDCRRAGHFVKENDRIEIGPWFTARS
jgi:hypothetical protein